MGGLVSSMADLNTVTQRLQHLSNNDPDKEIYVFYRSGERDPYTASDLYTLAGRFARRLHQHGFRKGDVIANTLPNSPERVITDLGIMMAGCIALNGQLLLSDGSDFFQNARKSRCCAVIVSSEEGGAALRLLKRYLNHNGADSFLTPLEVSQAEEMKNAILVKRESSGEKKVFIDDLRASGEEIFQYPVCPDDVFIVFTTSGSTGYSKLIHRSHIDVILIETYYATTVSPGRVWPDTKNKNFKYYSDRSLGWSVGLSTAPVCFGDTRVMADQFSAVKTGRDAWVAMTTERCEVCSLLCLEMEQLMEYLNTQSNWNYRLKMNVTGGQPLMKNQIKKFLQISEQVVNVYGSQEAGPFCTMVYNEKDTSYESNSNGQVIEGMSLRVVADDGRECEPNEFGTIQVKGYLVFKGYYNRLQDPDPQTTAAFTDDGWYNMEDYGYRDVNGNLFVFGRIKDVIIYGDEVFHPVWLEKKIQDHPDVLEACVVPVSDPVMYQNICACVKLANDSILDERQLRNFCEEIFLPEDPTTVSPKPKFYMIMKSDFPETATGKPDKQTLKRMAEEKYGFLTR
ncbi:hypothetical protein Btru_070546 [Bulinus truncatus]|nr:hypothetical protein Btru_070546 [Bulinus truncatus]